MAFADNLEYLNLNSVRSYPIRTGLDKTDISGQFTIPDSIILDLQLAVADSISKRYYISSIINRVDGIDIEISDETAVIGRFIVAKATHTDQQSYLFNDQTIVQNGSNAKIIIGNLDILEQLPGGQYTFTLASTEIEPKVTTPSLKGLSSIKFTDERGSNVELTRVVNLHARNNVRFRYSTVLDAVYFDAGDGLGLNKDCFPSRCVQTINGVAPDDSGNISILGLRCSGVSSPTANTIQLDDNCCTPCSGCDDLGILTERLTTLETKYIDLKSLYVNVDLQLSAYRSAVTVSVV